MRWQTAEDVAPLPQGRQPRNVDRPVDGTVKVLRSGSATHGDDEKGGCHLLLFGRRPRRCHSQPCPTLC